MNCRSNLLFLACLAAAGPVDALGFGIPISDTYVEGKMTLPSKATVAFVAREGVMVTLRQQGKDTLGLIFSFPDNRRDTSVVNLFKLKTENPGRELVVEFGYSLDEKRNAVFKTIDINGPALWIGEFSVSVQLNGSGIQTFSAKPPEQVHILSNEELQKRYGIGEVCCLTCIEGVLEFCATKISTSCGSCESRAPQ